jgi:hypothetical protein
MSVWEDEQGSEWKWINEPMNRWESDSKRVSEIVTLRVNKNELMDYRMSSWVLYWVIRRVIGAGNALEIIEALITEQL